MNTANNTRRELYYTNDHEWIDFQGSVAYVGICGFKLKGIRGIDVIEWAANDGPKEQGEVIGIIRYDDYELPVHMPVRGKVISINEVLAGDDRNVLLQQPEHNGWVALIVPDLLQERTGLIPPEEYANMIS